MPNTTTYDFGDVLLMEVYFTNQRQSEKRPVVVISSQEYNASHSDIVIMPITSQAHQSTTAGAIAIHDWQRAGLLHPSFVKPWIATYEQQEIIKRLGRIEDQGTRVALKKYIAKMLDFKVPSRPSST